MVFVNATMRDAYLVNPIHWAIGPYFDKVRCTVTLAFDYAIAVADPQPAPALAPASVSISAGQ